MTDIIYFDGKCALCHWSVRFILKHDKTNVFFFAPQKGISWRENEIDLAIENAGDSVLYFDGSKIYDRSDAALKIFQRMGSGWRLFTLLKIIPRAWRNGLYDMIARNRYRWFRQADECQLVNQLPEDRLLK